MFDPGRKIGRARIRVVLGLALLFSGGSLLAGGNLRWAAGSSSGGWQPTGKASYWNQNLSTSLAYSFSEISLETDHYWPESGEGGFLPATLAWNFVIPLFRPLELVLSAGANITWYTVLAAAVIVDTMIILADEGGQDTLTQAWLNSSSSGPHELPVHFKLGSGLRYSFEKFQLDFRYQVFLLDESFRHQYGLQATHAWLSLGTRYFVDF